MNSSRYPLFSGAGLVVLAVLLLAVIAISNTVLHGVRLDLTENKLFTLSQGTRNVLNNIDEPINLYFFFSKQTAQGLPSVNIYAQRVRDMLREMSDKANGKLKLHIIDPEPFSDEEDRAVGFHLQGVPIGNGGDTLYFGLAGSNSVGETAHIAFFQSDRESLLEYDLAKLIYQLSQTEKRVVGVISGLPVIPGLDREAKRFERGAVVGQQIKQLFDVRTIKKDAQVIPSEVEVLLLIHPQDLPKHTRYAIDQFLLRGGKALVMLDPFSAIQGRQGTREEPKEPVSELDPLLKSWGVKMADDKVVLDSEHAIQVTADPAKPPVYHFAMLSLPDELINQDDVTTRGLSSINFGFSGSLVPLKDGALEFTPLIRTGEKSQRIASWKVDPNMDPTELITPFRSEDKQHVIAARLSGTFKTAFPDGAPPKEEEPVDPNDPLAALGGIKPVQKPSEKEEEVVLPPHLSESEYPTNIILVADSDVLADQIWVKVQDFFGKRVASPWAGNGDFVMNSIDNLLGSSDVISIRSRAGFSRPFDRVESLKRAADAKFRATEQQLQEQLRNTEEQLKQFQAQRADGGVLLSPEAQETLSNFQKTKLDIRKQLRKVRHQLDEDIEQLGSWLRFINIALVPLLLIAGVLLFNLFKHLTRSRKGASA